MSYQRLTIQDFGSQLLDSCDLDPVYTALTNAGLDQGLLERWLIAYWCFYHCGFASWACERTGDKFWEVLDEAARNVTQSPVDTNWPRGRERRHFRGDKSVAAVAHLRSRYRDRPEDMLAAIVHCAPDYKALSARVRDHVEFGPWISFKVADMVDRVLGVNVDFSEAAVFMFKDPVKAAVMYYNQKHGFDLETGVEGGGPFVRSAIIPSVVAELTTYFAGRLAPPLYDRPVGLQEVETILCKWKSHMHGHYPLNNDIHEIREGVEPWTRVSDVAFCFLRGMPNVH